MTNWKPVHMPQDAGGAHAHLGADLWVALFGGTNAFVSTYATLDATPS